MPDVTEKAPGRRRLGAWRLGTPIAVMACGALFVTSGLNSDGTDLRPGRYTDLAGMVTAESDKTAELHARANELQRDVTRLSGNIDDEQLTSLDNRGETLDPAAGRTPVRGNGLTVTLSDAPSSLIESTTDPEEQKWLVVHQQDIQAVANAMWAGGAKAVTIQGQRIISTTGIKCEGNAVQLQGVLYSQPYVISAVGDPADMQRALERDDYVQGYKSMAEMPEVGIGWDLKREESITAPAYDGLLGVDYAEVDDS